MLCILQRNDISLTLETVIQDNFLRKKTLAVSNFFHASTSHAPMVYECDIRLQHKGWGVQIALEKKGIKVRFELLTPYVPDRCCDR